MKTLFWFVFGVAAGFVLAHLVDRDPRGHQVLSEVDARISEFTDRMGDAYREQEARFTATVNGSEQALSAGPATAGDAVSQDDAAPETRPTSVVEPAATDAPAEQTEWSESSVPSPKDVAEHTSVPQVNALADADDAPSAAPKLSD